MEKQARGNDFLKIINGTIQSKTYTFGAATIIIVIVLIAFAIRPTISKIMEERTQISEKKIIVEQLDSKLSAVASLSNEYASNESDIKDLTLTFPAGGNYSLLMSNLDEMASNNGFEMTGANFTVSETPPLSLATLQAWSIGVTVKGNKANIVDFLKKIENMPMFPIVTKFAYSDQRDEDGSSSFSFEIVAYKIADNNFYK